MQYEDLVGTPYQAMNCWALAVECFRRQGIIVPDVFSKQDEDAVAHAQAGWSAHAWIAERFGQWKRLDAPVIGCAVVFGNVDEAAVHIGVLVERHRFLHSMKKTGAVLSRLDRAPWCDTLLGAYGYAA